MTVASNVEAEIFDALFSHLEDGQSFSPPLRCAAPLVKFTPASDETYLRASFLPNQTNSMHVDKGQDQHFGIFQVMVMFPTRNEGLTVPLGLAGSIVSQFAKGTRLAAASGFIIKINRTPWMAPVLYEAARSAIPVSIPYETSVPS